LLLKEKKYKRIILDDSDKITIESYDGEILSIYDNSINDDDGRSNKMSIESYNDDEVEKDKETDEDKETNPSNKMSIESYSDDNEDKKDEKTDNDDEDKKDDETDEETIEDEETDEYQHEDEDEERPQQFQQQTQQKKRQSQPGSDDNSTEKKEVEKGQIAQNIIDMGKDLYALLQNIHKIPTPPLLIIHNIQQRSIVRYSLYICLR
jgi:hypothetical protein